MRTTLTFQTKGGRSIDVDAPTNAIAVANETEGSNSPCPSDEVLDELYQFRLMLGKANLHSKIVKVKATEHCSINYVILKDDSIENRMRAKLIADSFCRRAEYLYTKN